MIVELFFSEIAKISPGSEVTVIDFKPSKIPPRKVEVDKLRDLVTLRDEYVEHCKASGLCGRIYTRKVGRDRAFAGFNTLDPRGVLVNKHVGEAAVAI